MFREDTSIVCGHDRAIKGHPNERAGRFGRLDPIVRDKSNSPRCSSYGSEHKQRKTGLDGPIFQVMTLGRAGFGSFTVG